MAAQSRKLLAIEDTPHSIALGSAVGMFFGFTPLFGLKTLLSIAVAWIFRSNKMASVICVTLHDLMLPLTPVMFIWEYKLGIWLLHGYVPHSTRFGHVALLDYMEWTTLFTLGQPLLIGSLFLAFPGAVVTYFLLRGVLFRARAARDPG